MNSPPWLKQRTSQNVHQRSACLVKKDLMRAMVKQSDEANIFRDAPVSTQPNLIGFKNVGQGTYRLERCFLQSDITTLCVANPESLA